MQNYSNRLSIVPTDMFEKIFIGLIKISRLCFAIAMLSFLFQRIILLTNNVATLCCFKYTKIVSRKILSFLSNILY